jgi:hypothetical protein
MGCSSSGDGGGTAPIATTTLAGKIGGQSWTLGSANSDSFLSSGSPNFFVDMYSEASIACGGSPTNSNENSFIANVPMTMGDYSLSLDLSATFVVGGSQNLIATSGHLAVTSVSSSTVTGGLNVSYNSDNAIDGQFTITVCP